MHKGSVTEALSLAEALISLPLFPEREVAIAPPFTVLFPVAERLRHGKSQIKLSAQNVHSEAQGAYTGEISATMLAHVGCSLVLVGHSERRVLFSESDEFINRKLLAVIAAGMRAVLCVGETMQERERGQELQVVRGQIEKGLAGVSPIVARAGVVIAYEPIWAIGTGKTASPRAAQEMHAFIKERLTVMYGLSVANEIRILYGGSVKPENIRELMEMPDINGVLVGGASLELESFRKIICY
jgi:triosephosphate isomerase